uniref:ARAD1A04554p n=1 Tax=Blastobotrys adeninivorans TaxID=409370 RepID=A0A060SWG7_BLAAD
MNPFDVDYTNRDHLVDFERALHEDEASYIISVNDWAPVNAPLKRRLRRKPTDSDPGTGLGYTLFRWPILVAIALWLALLAFVYAIVRFWVALFEYFITWRGPRRKLRENLRSARSYEEWINAAKVLDDHLGNTSWKHSPKFSRYDYRTIGRITNSLRQLRSQNKAEEVGSILQGCVKHNFAGTQGQPLYSQCYYGTKDLVEEFNSEIVKSLDYLATHPNLTPQSRRLLFKMFSKNFGKTALCLSGGATFAYRHFGVVKALLEQDLLPNIISGTSGGGLVAALVGTRTNSELRELLTPQLADKITACWEKFPKWVYRFYSTGARFDAVDWAERSCWFTMGSLTFREAYERTGKILNISTVPADPNSPSILCNYITSPDCVIWSALLASAAVPGILNPVVLMMKTKKGNLVPYSFGNKWKDGSLRTDIPVHALNVYFNVNFTIVSQVNPHISLFMYAPRGTVGRPVSHRQGKGWRGGFLGSALEDMLKLEIRKWLKLMKNLSLMPRFFNQDWSSVWLQKFEGSVTLWPRIRLKDFYYILSDPTREQMETMIISGQRCTFPKLLFIRHQVNIERAIDRGRKQNAKAREENGPQLRRVNPFLQDLDDRVYHSSSSVDPREFQDDHDDDGENSTDSSM